MQRARRSHAAGAARDRSCSRPRPTAGRGHYEGDAQPYKPAEESAAWRERDPLLLARRRLLEDLAATDEQLDAAESLAREIIEEAVVHARAAATPGLEEAYAHVFTD